MIAVSKVQQNQRSQEYFQELRKVMVQFEEFSERRVPLCAAETVISPFARIPLTGEMQERYIMGGVITPPGVSNFIGSEVLFPVYELVSKLCLELFGAAYADPRTLSGTTCMISLLMSLAKQGEQAVVLSPKCGGHPSIPHICRRLGIECTECPYDYSAYDIDIAATNKLIRRLAPRLVVLAPSDLIVAPSVSELELAEETILLYDATQILGLVAGKVVPNPLAGSGRVVIAGGTHKTLPGPTNGLVLCNDSQLAKRIDETINPMYLRNTCMHQVLCLAFVLLEMMDFGVAYMQQIQANVTVLGKLLLQSGFNVARVGTGFGNTHQLFVHMDPDEMSTVYSRCLQLGVSINQKRKPLFRDSGLRIGLQEVTRYGWNSEEMKIIAELLSEIRRGDLVRAKEHARYLARIKDRLYFSHSPDAIFT